MDANQEETKKSLERNISETNSNVSVISENAYTSDIRETGCLQHRNSETISFPKVKRKFRRGCCLAHSENGYIAYSGIDLDSGQLVYITEWLINQSQIEQTCDLGDLCPWVKKCQGTHSVKSIKTSIERQVLQLMNLNHEYLVRYECVLCEKYDGGLRVYLVQDFVHGNSLSKLSANLGWAINGVRKVARSVLEALVFLNSKGLSHNQLSDRTIFMDNTGDIRCTDYSLVANLLQLTGILTEKSKRGDLPDLGALINSIWTLDSYDIWNFTKRCESGVTATDLLEDPFLRVFEDSTSRFRSDYDDIKHLGKGAFGSVLKVRNILENRHYAIKRIPFRACSQINDKIIREVKLLAGLNHWRVVRYFSSWIESATVDDMDEIKHMVSGDYTITDENSSSKCYVYSSEFRFNDSNSFLHNKFDHSENGKSIEVDNNKENIITSLVKPQKPPMQILYIQMQFSGERTLRTVIDEQFNQNPQMLCKLLTQIISGLSYIHRQEIIHRDLKPENIFLDWEDEVQIGDFGLATTNFDALLADVNIEGHDVNVNNMQTKEVGTALYVAPEMSDNGSQSSYTNKVDMYSLGIIIFEIFHPPFSTVMERIKTLEAVRAPNVILPECMLNSKQYESVIKVIQWLLHHNPSMRPSAQELLRSKLLEQMQNEVLMRENEIWRWKFGKISIVRKKRTFSKRNNVDRKKITKLKAKRKADTKSLIF